MSVFEPKGIVPPICTPFTEDQQIDISSLERLLEFQIGAGIHGLFMLGSTSETALLTFDQRVQVLETAVRVTGGRLPIMAGTMDSGTDRVLEHALAAKKAGVDALVVTAPYYIRPGNNEILDHFRIIKKEVGLPIVAYDIPVAVHTKLPREVVLALFDEGTIVGIKDSSGDEGNFRGLLIASQSRPGFSVMTGSELIVDGVLAAGAHGCVPGIGNVDPHAFVKIWNAVQAGDHATAKAEQDRVYKLFGIIGCAEPGRMGPTSGALGGFKTALMLRGLIATNIPGRPMIRLNDAEIARVRTIVEAAGLV